MRRGPSNKTSVKRACAGLAALVLLLLSAPALAAPGGVEGGRLFAAKGCSACHLSARPAKPATIEGRMKRRGPELWYAGDKFRDGFLASWLTDPKPIRPLAYNSLTQKNAGRHPRLEGGEAEKVAEYLMGLRAAGVEYSPLKARRSLKGRFIFEKRLGCYGCHLFRSGARQRGGLTGPSLTGASKRLRAAWVYAYLVNPGAFTPVSPMPGYTRVASDAELKAVAEYVSSFK